MANEILERLKQHFPKEIASTVVGYHVKIDEAQSRGLSIFEYAPRDRGAAAMAALAEELVERCRPEPRVSSAPPAPVAEAPSHARTRLEETT
jgi:chromosome partitioning protein